MIPRCTCIYLVSVWYTEYIHLRHSLCIAASPSQMMVAAAVLTVHSCFFVACVVHREMTVVVAGRERETAEDPNLLVLPGGKTFYMQRRLVNSLFGAVFHGIRGHLSDVSK